jgi:hypothetical protein
LLTAVKTNTQPGESTFCCPAVFFRRLVSMNCLIERNEVFPVLSFVERLSIGD